ncbi:MAG TPA: alpha/beta hydrolase-fold protein [Polyangia bacterium]|nr:alpha/beta hydrolase-fold protein [Polyangia bacterium]
MTPPPPNDAASTTADAPAPPRDTGAVEVTPGRDAGVTPVDSSATDPGTAGDGVRTLMGPYKKAPEYTRQAGVPQGKTFDFEMGVASTIYPKAPTTRKIAVYVPAQYEAGTPAPVMVFQDGTDFYGFDTSVPTVFDNLIATGAMPPTVAVFAGNGGGDSVGSERGLEYDTVSGLYAEWVDTELLPRVEMETQTQLPAQAVTFTKDPEGRGAVGGSSGGAATFSMAWWHPDLFRRVITFSGTFVNQVPANSPFPHGCWIYHDEDPYDAATPNGLIVAHCESATSPGAGSSNPGPCDTPLTQTTCEAVAGCAWNTAVNEPIRAWLESGTNDDGAGGAPSTYRNFDLANQRMAASLMTRGYHFHYDHAQGAGHVDNGVLTQTLPEALTWVWRGYVAP